jgi:CheY-like chemotaxis protein
MELEQPTPSSAASTSDEGESSAGSSTLFFEKGDTILVVDDVGRPKHNDIKYADLYIQNADMRAYIRKIFTPYLRVLEAHDGVEALQVARSQRLNLVLW